ncbi:MAG: SUMF1/EgtB/PvdO family nonheme iron enzyme, partial [Planctomycetota bacterium]
ELFDPGHKSFRGKEGYSNDDDEAVHFVNWYDAQAFCRWLSDKEGLEYRLPTEAEWEYACRAGTTTNFYTGDFLSEDFHGNKKKSSLHVGKTIPNKWGIYDMSGNVEEWCYDWYGPYQKKRRRNPIGYIDGDFRVLRGGSLRTEEFYLRSGNRMAAIPATRNWLTGFRVVLGQMPRTKPLAMPKPPLNQQKVVKRSHAKVTKGPDPQKPYYRGPYRYVNIPVDAIGPLFASHNHDPAIVECPNGDLLSIWYTCVDEGARELGQAASRLRFGEVEWEPASVFFDVPDRNDHGPALWYDGRDTIYHFTGVGTGPGGRGRMAMVMRTSKDSGKTWSKPRFAQHEFSGGHQVAEPVFRMSDGTIVITIDGKRTLWMSRDEGLTWTNPGGSMVGIHAGVVQLKDGSIFGLTRDDGESGMMPISLSTDGGKTFTYSQSEFPPVGGGQRLALLRLREGPLFFASFAGGDGLEVTDTSGNKRTIRGLYTAISEDEGKTWPWKRLVSDDGPPRTIECTDGGAVTLSAYSSEYRGYLSACQSLDGLVHLISSRNHFAFNLKWLKSRPGPPVAGPLRVTKLVETFDGPKKFDNEGWLPYKSHTGGFNGKGQYTVKSMIHYQGWSRVVGSGSFEALFSVKNIHFNYPGKSGTEGMTMGFKDSFNKGINPTMTVSLKENSISSGLGRVPLSKMPVSAKIKYIWNEKTLQWKVYYGLDGEEPIHEFRKSKEGFYYKKPTTESLAAAFLMSNGSVDIDHFEIRPIEP